MPPGFLYRQRMGPIALVALFAVSLLVTQLAIVGHDAHHHDHEHTKLCDAFMGKDPGKNLLIVASPLGLTLPLSGVIYLFSLPAPFQVETGVARIRGPPAYLI